MNTADTRSLVIEREMPFPPEKIWRALTEGALIKEWMLENDFKPVIGHRFKFRAPPMPQWDGVIHSEILAIEPNRKLSYSWGSLGLETVVVWTLVATSGGTLLRMEQSGFRADQKAEFGGAKYGWQNFIGQLERVVAGLK